MFRHIIPPPPGHKHHGLSIAAVQAQAKHMVPANFFRLSRLSLFARIFRDPAPLVLTMLFQTRSSPRSWVKAVLDDFEYLSAASSTFRSMMTASLHEWIDFFRESGRKAVVAVKKALAEDRCNVVDAPVASAVAGEEYSECNVCGHLQPTLQQLEVHLSKMHNRNRSIRRRLPYPVTRCDICILEKHTRNQLAQHLTDRSKCVE